jgi:hypothetical protein
VGRNIRVIADQPPVDDGELATELLGTQQVKLVVDLLFPSEDSSAQQRFASSIG